jgi:hypothetical protein
MPVSVLPGVAGPALGSRGGQSRVEAKGAGCFHWMPSSNNHAITPTKPSGNMRPANPSTRAPSSPMDDPRKNAITDTIRLIVPMDMSAVQYGFGFMRRDYPVNESTVVVAMSPLIVTVH